MTFKGKHEIVLFPDGHVTVDSVALYVGRRFRVVPPEQEFLKAKVKMCHLNRAGAITGIRDVHQDGPCVVFTIDTLLEECLRSTVPFPDSKEEGEASVQIL